MGIINQIKKMFSKNIDCTDMLENSVFHYYNKSRVFTIGSNIIVPEGFNAVFVCKDQVCDVLPNGKFALSSVNMPKTFSVLKLAKASKKGKLPEKFVADLYFVYIKNATNLKYISYVPYTKMTKRYGHIKAYVEGSYDMMIYDSAKLMEYILKEYPCVQDELFLSYLGGLIGDSVVDEISKLNKSFLELLTSTKEINQILNTPTECDFGFAGFKIFNVTIDSMNVKGKVKRLIERDMSEQMTTKNNYIEVDDHLPKSVVVGVQTDEIMQPMDQEEIDIICSSCGHKLHPGARYCDFCGHKQTKD